MNILYIDIGNRLDDSHMYKYYGDLYRELVKLTTIYVAPATTNINLLLGQISERIDCVIFGLGYFAQNDPRSFGKIEGLAELDIPVVCLFHKPQTMLAQKLEFCQINKIDLFLDSQITYKKYGEMANVRSMRSWHTASPEIFHPRDIAVEYDLGFVGAAHGNNKVEGETRNLRDRIYDQLAESDYKIFWKKHHTPGDRIPSVEEYAACMNKCKMWISTTGPMLDVGPRYFEVALSKTLLLCNYMPHEYEGVFEDGVNCVMFKNDLSNLEEKINYYLEHDEERQLIVERAYEKIINNYTWERMAQNLLETVEELKNGTV